MTDTKFTPGPWQLTQGKVKRDGSRPCHISCYGWSKFAKVWVRTSKLLGGDVDDIDGIANAHLIAAAPDLYEAAQLGAELAAYQNDEDAYRIISAALAKARGEQ